jgi:methionyl-tRNA formyltransferase
LKGRELRIGWVGFHREGVPALEALLAEGYNVTGVITLAPSALAKRSGAVNFGSILANRGVPVYEVTNINDHPSIEILESMDLDLAFVIGWSQILGPEALSKARIGMVGAHASLLPENRGSAPINWALIRGLKRTGNSLIWLAEGVDEGKIIDQVEFEITEYDTCATLYERVAESNREMILLLLPRLARGERPGRSQPVSDQPLLPRRKPEEGQIDWTRSADEVYDWIRALTRPYPGAFGWLEGEKCIVWESARLASIQIAPRAPGTVLGPVVSPSDAACGQLVACGEGAILLLEVETPAGELLHGRRLSREQWTGKVWKAG